MFTQLPFLKPQFIAPTVVIIFLIVLVRKYLVSYRSPAKRLRVLLHGAVQNVLLVKSKAVTEQRTALRTIFKGTALDHSWLEFEETLHDQCEIFDGESHVSRIRATAPASYFFSAQKIIETPLRTEYFKHLPGILTGIGIIGTFAGLMLGLYHFDPSDPSKVQESVTNLLTDVLYAFAGSMCSIVVAMLITHSEKENLRLCIEVLEKLTDAIDRIFDAGVSEEYLAELVRHTQESSTQTRMLKDSLVTDLREMLQNLVDTQVRENLKLAETLSNSYKDSGRDIAVQISDSIEASFREPLTLLAKSVQTATGDQSGKVQTLLQDVLVAFMQKLESTFGNQFSGMQEMLQQSITSMQQMQGMFSGLVQDMRSASESSGQAVQEQLAKTLADMHSNQSVMQNAMNEMVGSLQAAVANIGSQGEQAGSRMGDQVEKIFAESEARQQVMAEQMQSFVDSLKESVGKGQQDTMQRISDTVDQLGNHLGLVLQDFEKNRQAMDGASEKAYAAQQEQMGRALAGMHDSQTTMQNAMNEMMTGLQNTVISIGDQGEQAGAMIGKQLEKQYSENAERQQSMTSQLDSFISGIQDNIANGQSDTMKKIASTVDDLGGKLNSIVATFEKNRHAMDEESISSQQQLQATTKALIEELSAQVKMLLSSLQQGHDATRQTIKLLGEQTDRTFTGLQLGADKINAAAGEFTIAGHGIAQITNASANLAGQIQGSAGELSVASRELANLLNDYQGQRDALHQSIGIIESIVANAQAESGMRGQVIIDLKNVSDRMQELNQEAANYLDQVTGVLGKSFDSFGTGVEKGLTRTLATFDAELDTAIKALGGGVQELSENLDVFSEMVEKSTRLHRVA
jgi:putative membrane protein